ncbi:hypothetical protein [Acidiphilium acidophilum]|uniref:Uncharacterized protein n=1 Tax=Acidiphilium acidophilum TaxID=76588 RepID=A0AAW9DMZ8_ACIAO|nr:hypothetical protein [Acidiphilium acidophilum]MDX5930370.1 hypothetical protein [Acidiphilium acidophilum]
MTESTITVPTGASSLTPELNTVYDITSNSTIIFPETLTSFGNDDYNIASGSTNVTFVIPDITNFSSILNQGNPLDPSTGFISNFDGVERPLFLAFNSGGLR